MPVNDGGNRGLKNDLRLGIRLDAALFDGLVIADQPLHAVRGNAVKIGEQQHVGDLCRLRCRKAEFFKGIAAKTLQPGDAVLNGIHISSLFSFGYFYCSANGAKYKCRPFVVVGLSFDF